MSKPIRIVDHFWKSCMTLVWCNKKGFVVRHEPPLAVGPVAVGSKQRVGVVMLDTP